MKLATDVSLLSACEPAAVELLNPGGRSPFVLLCDHASNRIPRQLGQLGLTDEELHSHIGRDAGAQAVAAELSVRLDAPLVQANYSRLVIDCNRALSSSESILTVSDGIAIGGNQQIEEAERQLRQQEIFLPYHRCIAELLESHRHPDPVLLSIHSFTPILQGKRRPWEIAVCYGQDRRLADMFLELLPRFTKALIGNNEPFDIDPDIDHTLPYHAERRKLLHVMLELRRDCIESPKQVSEWADTIAAVCQEIERTIA